jgi:hypothetical protein
MTSTTLGPSLGASDDTIPAQVLDGDRGEAGLDLDVTAGSLTRLHGNAIALGRHRAASAHAHVGQRVPVTLGDGTHTNATVVAIYNRDLAFGEALLAPELAAGHRTTPLIGTILVQTDRPAATARRLAALGSRYPGLAVSDRASLATATDADREMNRWLGPIFVAIDAALAGRAHREDPRRPDVAGVGLLDGFEHRHAPLLRADLDGPVQRRRATVAARSGVHHQATVVSPHRLGDERLEHRTHDQLWLMLGHGGLDLVGGR